MSERDRLTQKELSWLLTQEARGAADRLLKGVQILKNPPPTDKVTIENAPESSRTSDGVRAHRVGERRSDRPISERPITLSLAGEDGDGLQATLAALDGAMNQLATLHAPASQRRRGKVDVAAVLWEVAPHATVQLEPGAGTDVLGDATELRRMIHVLMGGLSQAGVGGAQVISLRREGDEVVLSVGLGPDTTPMSQAERAWLSRMAIRFGGRHELDGSSECLAFPAMDVEEREEMQSLRRELEAAKAQGEAYARELAAVFAEPSQSTRPPPLSMLGVVGPAARLRPLARIADAMIEDLRVVLGPLGAAGFRAKRDPSPTGGQESESPALLKEVHDALGRGAELLSLLREMARIGQDIDGVPVDLATLAREESQHAMMAFGSRGVMLDLQVSDPQDSPLASPYIVQGGVCALRAMVAELLDRGLRSAPAGGKVTLHTERTDSGHALILDVSGTESAEAEVLDRRSRSALEFLREIARAHGLGLRVDRTRVAIEVPLAD